MSVEKEIRKILGEATPAAVRAKQELVRSGLGHDKNAAATMAALKNPEEAMKSPAKRELLLKVMQDLLDVVVNDPSMVMKTKSALRKEEVEVIEEATVKTEKHSWGTMKTVHHGKDFSIPLHPEHHKAISKLNDGESHTFTDETNSKWKATREGDKVHFTGASSGVRGSKTTVAHSALKEEIEELEEKLVGGQKKLDKNKNGKLDAEDFKKLRAMKEEEEIEEAKMSKKDKEDDEDEENEKEDEKEDEVELSKDQVEKMIASMKKAKGFKAHIKTLQGENLGAGEYNDPISRMRKKENEEKKKKETKEEYVSNAQRKAVWASRNDEKEAMKRKTKKEGLDEAVDPSEVAGNPKAYSTSDVKKAYYHKSTSSDDKKALELHLDRRHGNRDWRKPVKEEEEVQVDEAYNDYFARRKREEDIISGKKPARKKAPAQTSDYQKRRNKEKANEEVQVDENLSKVPTDKLKKMWDSHKNEQRPSPAFASHLKRIAGELKKRKLAKEEVQVNEEMKQRVLVTVSDPNHTMASMRKEKIQKTIRVSGSKETAVDRAKTHYKKQGYKVHDAEHVGTIGEAVTTDYNLVKGQTQNKAPAKKLATDYKLATKKTQKEEVQIDELDKSTVKSYLDKVRFKQARSAVQANMGTPGMKKKHSAELEKTAKSMETAKKRLAKEEVQIDEAGPFSYGKPPRKGSVADLAAKKRKEMEKGKQPIEPKDHMVGVAKVVKEAFPTVADARKRMKDALKQKFDKKKISTGTVYTKKYKEEPEDEKKSNK